MGEKRDTFVSAPLLRHASCCARQIILRSQESLGVMIEKGTWNMQDPACTVFLWLNVPPRLIVPPSPEAGACTPLRCTPPWAAWLYP